MKRIFLAWKPFCSRSQNLAKHFGAKIIYIHPFSSDGNPAIALTRYIVSFFITMKALIKKKPDVVFTLNQPILLLAAILMYTKARGRCYVLDSHSAPFNNPSLAWLKPAYKFFAKRALFNINTNGLHRQLIESWGGKSYIIGDVPIDFNEHYPEMNLDSKSIAVVMSFMFDEPIDEIFESARMVPSVSFYVTGNYKKAKKGLLKKAPENIKLQGFLSREDYIGLLLGAKAVMALTKRDLTMQRGAYEALSLERPIITSDWPILRESFGPAAVYTDNSPETITACVNELLENHDKYLAAVALQRKKRREFFDHIKAEIEEELSRSISSAP